MPGKSKSKKCAVAVAVARKAKAKATATIAKKAKRAKRAAQPPPSTTPSDRQITDFLRQGFDGLFGLNPQQQHEVDLILVPMGWGAAQPGMYASGASAKNVD